MVELTARRTALFDWYGDLYELETDGEPICTWLTHSSHQINRTR